jgi:cytochrome c peroxidase
MLSLKDKIERFLFAFLSLLLIVACNPDEEPDMTPVYHATPYEITIPQGFPTKMNIPDENPLTYEGIELGRYLFYDGRLSGRTHPDSLMSCASCHLQSRAFECGIDHPVYTDGFTHGLTGKPTPHVMLPLINLVWNQNGYLWNGRISETNPDPRFRNIEDLVWMGVLAEHEMHGDTNRVKELFGNIPEYRELFRKAFGSDDVTMDRISKAVAQFIRTLISSNSKFDRFLRGEEQLTGSELRGYVLFTTEEGADCFHCHGGAGNPLFTTNLFYNNGKDSVFTDQKDRYAYTGNPVDKGAYKATTLRNIEYTAPYMHDGRFSTLEEVIDFYAHELIWTPYIDPLMHHIANGGNQLTPSEKDDLLAFLLSLSDTTFLTNPAFGKPDTFPEGKQQE